MLSWLALPLVAAALAQGASFTTVVKGDASNQLTGRQVAIRTMAEWQALWKDHSPAEKMPAVDFSSRMVVGLFLGSKPSTGYQVEIVAVQSEGDTLIVNYLERQPARGMLSAQILTEPFHLVAVPRHGGPVKFNRIEAAAKP
jgi:hypothetical protein